MVTISGIHFSKGNKVAGICSKHREFDEHCLACVYSAWRESVYKVGVLTDAILKAPHNQYCHARRWVPGDCTCYKKSLLAKLDN